MWTFFLDSQQIKEPIGFDAIEFTAKRLESHGIDQPFTTELSFIGAAAKILKEYWDAEFINAVVPFQIQTDTTIGTDTYEFDGLINFGIYEETRTCDQSGWIIKVGILESDFKSKLISRQDIEVDLLTLTDLDGEAISAVTPDEIRLHSQELYLQAEAAQDELVEFEFTSAAQSITFPVYWDNTDFAGLFGSTFDQSEGFTSGTTLIWKNNGLGERSLEISGRAKGSVFNRHPTNAYNMFIILGKVNNVGASVPAESITLLTHLIPANTTYNFDLTFGPNPMSFLEEYGLVYTIEFDFGNIFGYEVTWTTDNRLKIAERSKYVASTCQGLTVYNALLRTLQIVTGDNTPLLSETFGAGGCYENNFLTTGLYIRNAQLFDDVDPRISTSWMKLFENLDRIFCLGWQFEQVGSVWKVRVETREYFYDRDTQLASFLKVADPVQSVYVEGLKNGFIFGFTNSWKNNNYSGIFEVHTDRKYYINNRARANNSSDVMDLRSEIICAGTAIEFSRRLQFFRENSGSSDRQNDYDMFLIWTNRAELTINPIEGTGYELEGQTGSQTFDPGKVSFGSDYIGYSSPEIDNLYNIYHTPTRIAARHWGYWGMVTFGLVDAKKMFAFQVGEYWTEYESEIGTESAPTDCNELVDDYRLAENSNINAALFKADYQIPYLKPISLSFEVPQALCDFITMSLGNGYVALTSGNTAFAGFIMEATNQPQNPQSGKTKFQLILASPEIGAGPFDDSFADEYDN